MTPCTFIRHIHVSTHYVQMCTCTFLCAYIVVKMLDVIF